jgi:hypothetical protein
MSAPSYAAIMDSTITGTENTICVKIINQIPELTRFNPLVPQRRRTDNPSDDVGIINGIFSNDRIMPPYHFRSIINVKGTAIHIETKVATKATMREVKVALVKVLK